MCGINEERKGLERKYRYNLTKKNIRCYCETGVSFTCTDNRRKGFWTIVES